MLTLGDNAPHRLCRLQRIVQIATAVFFNLFAAAEPSVNVALLMEPCGIGSRNTKGALSQSNI